MLTVYTLNEAEKWDSIVSSFAEYDIYWMSGYVKAFQINGDGEPLLFYYNDEQLRGINVVLKRDISKDPSFIGVIPENTHFDFSTPYGYGGWLIEGLDPSSLFKTYNDWMQENGIISEFVRFHPLIKNHNNCSSFYSVVQLGEVVHMDLSSPEEIWNNLISKNRNMIRKAQKNDIKIYNGRFPQIFETFKKIYNSTMDKDKADKYYYFNDEFYNSILYDLPFNSQIFWAEKDDKIIATSIVLTAKNFMNYHLSGSLNQYNIYAPTNLLLYYAALWGCANGYKTFYLGGGVGSQEDGLLKFKKSFYRGQLNHFYIGKKIINSSKYNELIDIVNKDNESNFFPKYRG